MPRVSSVFAEAAEAAEGGGINSNRVYQDLMCEMCGCLESNIFGILRTRLWLRGFPPFFHSLTNYQKFINNDKDYPAQYSRALKDTEAYKIIQEYINQQLKTFQLPELEKLLY
ncbi:jg2231 [Pararge aegeria aegeria]|uniref:Jg2231 protein n=1 Tax=Pararge aegeria aegeria TaxID=348720 RepID=A0A8S4SM22_9NEOP|nr:jg2231 [Pararge aegeria aegeria]